MKAALAVIAGAIIASTGAAADDPPPYQPSKDLVSGNELALVYIGESHCAPCKSPGMKEAVQKAKAIFAQRAAAEHRPFSATGVSIDTDIEAGIAFLKPVGPFDQIIVGREWFNSAVLDFLGGNRDAILGVPQLIIYERTLTLGARDVSATPPKILARIPGTGIPLWVNAGAKLKGD